MLTRKISVNQNLLCGQYCNTLSWSVFWKGSGAVAQGNWGNWMW